MSRRLLALAAALAATAPASLLLPACSDEGSTALATESIDLARERAAAHFQKDERGRAREALKPLVERKDAALEDLVRAAAVELADNQTQAAQGYLDRAAKLDAQSAAVHYLLGQMAREAGDAEAARSHFRAANAAAPDDLPTRLALAEAEDELENTAEALRLYESVVQVGMANGGSWYVAAVYRLSNLLTRAGREQEAARFDAVRRQLELRQIQAPDTIAMLLGELGRVRPPKPAGTRPAAPAGPLTLRPGPTATGVQATMELLALDVDGDLLADLVARDAAGFTLLRSTGGALAEPVTLAAPGAGAFALFDVEGDGDLDLALVEGGRVALHLWSGAGWTATACAWPELPGGPDALVAVDYDHEGDLDLVLAGASGLRVWRNDSAIERAKDGTNTLKEGRFVDATEGSGLATDRAFAWCVPEDYDGDNDVDLLAGGAGGIVLYDSLRDGKFAARTGLFDLPPGVTSQPLVADLDGDARADLWFPGAPSWLVLQGHPAQRRADVRVEPGSIATGDVDRDGALDVVWSDAEDGALRGRLDLGLASERDLALQESVSTAARVALGDCDGDGRLDLAQGGADGVRVLANAGPTGRGARIALRGNRDNRRGVGATVEVRAGGVYRRVYARGEALVLGAGAAERFDVLRVTWPNGVVDTRLDVALAAPGPAFADSLRPGEIAQTDGQVGSCPFLYAWNGTTYGFVSDVLGITPLGLRMAPGMLVPPDHDEYVLVTGEQLAPKDGEYVLQLTEELREVTYFDHAKLLVVDHPADTEVFPNERFQFPPFPAPHVHTVRAPLVPERATGSDGRDWRAAVERTDDVVAQPMENLAALYAGLAKPWFLELAFDREAVRAAPKLRLVLTGWFYWSDASANLASARALGEAFVPPLLQVPDGQGGWRDATPPIGFPAGKTKTMVVDVTDVLNREDPRVRVATTLRLYWDRVALAVDADDAPLDVRELACTGADAWARGFSAPLDRVPPGEAHPQNKPERFDWDALASEPRWNQHPGRYTRYGDCRELVEAVDDRFVILGAGDALTLRFAAPDLAPPKPGLRRDYLVYLDGWAKDRDPNTLAALAVEPLPFHAMSGYPYGPDERFPEDEAHERWRREWLTRPAQEWIAPVSPRREVEWLLGP